jgi:hypothetical protein
MNGVWGHHVCEFYVMNRSIDFHKIWCESFVETMNRPCGVVLFLGEQEFYLLCSILILIVMILVQQRVWSTKTRWYLGPSWCEGAKNCCKKCQHKTDIYCDLWFTASKEFFFSFEVTFLVCDLFCILCWYNFSKILIWLISKTRERNNGQRWSTRGEKTE